ncbi:response regulator [Arenibacter sp. BSSL-BM3]|uniref:Response regulator n=1 Tax=Arenibacter arenosicollis TaxID=2762274 RepID=A0ABR7QRR4_9FLAO|nr:response regulator [Arenibacter arenosicollis]MBC8769867.1 response regulator [Arenibacter arenosicollis]
MDKIPYILLADDDPDDCMFFREALEALSFLTTNIIVYDGEELMQLLSKNTTKLPDVLFLDLNIPRKTGFQCLKEIKNDVGLSKIPVVIISTSYDRSVADGLYQNGATYFIQKPVGFSQLLKLISLAIELVIQKNGIRTEKNNFLLQ